jgi:DNA-directed RNA polymerase specialized sigma24 family protein
MEEQFTTTSHAQRFDFNEEYITRLRLGDEQAWNHFVRFFTKSIRLKFWGRFSPDMLAELTADTMSAATEKILAGEPRDPASLPGYVRGIASNLAARPFRDRFLETDELDAESIPFAEPSQDKEMMLVALDRALKKLPARDRETLLQYYEIAGKEKTAVRRRLANERGITSGSLQIFLNRTRKRLKKTIEKELELMETIGKK